MKTGNERGGKLPFLRIPTEKLLLRDFYTILYRLPANFLNTGSEFDPTEKLSCYPVTANSIKF